MAKHTALLLGCGTIGAEVARLLVADEVFSGVLIADQDVARAQQIAAEVGEKATPLQADVEDVTFPEPVGLVRVHLAGHCEPVTLPRFLPGLQTVEMKAGFTVEAANRVLHDVIRYGFTATEPIRVGSTHITPADFTAAFLSSPAADHVFQAEQTMSHIARQVQAKGTQDGRTCVLTMQVVMAAGARVIAMPLAVAARLLVLGQVPRTGLLSPEALDPRPFLET